jgi:hypothetical protein
MTGLATQVPVGGVLATRRLQVVLARIGLSCNRPELLHPDRYLDPDVQERQPVIWSFLSALNGVAELPDETEVDGWIHLLDSADVPPSAQVAPESALLIGDFSSWEQTVGDRRWTLYGNAGFLSKFVYATLERCYGMLSFHAVALYDEPRHQLYVAIGSAGAGKTVTMFEGVLKRGWRVFATEMTHVNFEPEGAVFYKGSMYDNVRVANLRDFPEAETLLRVPTVDPRAKDPKVCLSFRPVEAGPDRLVNPKLTLLFPRIESERSTVIAADIADEDALVKQLYENASEMILRPRVYYSRLAVGPIEYPNASQLRYELCRRLAREARLEQARSIMAGPRDSLSGVR